MTFCRARTHRLLQLEKIKSDSSFHFSQNFDFSSGSVSEKSAESCRSVRHPDPCSVATCDLKTDVGVYGVDYINGITARDLNKI